ncbi:MAG: peptidase domain-containing ABC transporter [Bacteroidetes bacterium]|nr:peptidase domain-containing ABC transporter [Bacteroidota bacterium]
MKLNKSFPFIQQNGMMECGTTCLAMIFKHYGYYNIQTLLTKLGEVTTEGTSLYNMAQLAEQFGFKADGYELHAYEHLAEVQLPCIAHYNGVHFIIVYKFSRTHVWIADPAYGKDKLTKKEFLNRWNGVILVVEPTEEIFKNKDLTESVEEFMKEKKSLWKKFYAPVITSLKKVIIEVLLATFFLQFLGLAIPFFTQLIVDDVLVNQNKQLLVAILVGMAGIFLTQILLIYVRNVLLIQLQINFELDFFSRFFRHFISLKQKYYDNNKREDFMARFQENITIRQLVNPAVIESIVDILFILLYLPVLIIYNLKLGLLALLFVVIFFIFTLYYAPVMRLLVYKVFYKNLETLGEFLDSLLGVKTVKLLSLENFKIVLKNLSFRYSGSEENYQIRNVNLEINKGENIGIVGRNGSGKTTLVKLLLNLYPDYEGEISMDQHELRKINPNALRSKIFLFPQDIYIFSGTIKENIQFGNLDADLDAIIQAAKLANLHDYVKGLYLGYNHKVGDTGGNLSGGQKLKIGFARLFISNPDVIILDEASSMLDIESETIIMNNIRSHFKGKTIISIAHRLNTLKNADRVLVLESGEVVEDGHHDQLIALNGLYYKFMKTYVDY